MAHSVGAAKGVKFCNRVFFLCFRILLIIPVMFVSANAAAQIITTVAGNGVGAEAGDGKPATAAEINAPDGIALDDSGNMYISDNLGNTIREVRAKTGVIMTIAGNRGTGFSGDGGPATAAELYWPEGIVLDNKGNLYIADTFNQRIRKVSLNTGEITTVAGNGTVGYSGDGGQATAAEFYDPQALVLDSSGNLDVVDGLNNAIRNINLSTGLITTLVGTGTAGYYGDGGQATAARLTVPTDMAFDGSWNMYISDNGNSVIRKVDDKTGVITTFAGNGVEAYSGDGGPATAAGLDGLSGIAIDKAGNVYTADFETCVIRKIDVYTGTINTIVGNTYNGFSGDGGPATNAEIYSPMCMKVDNAGTLYFDDSDNNRIRKVTDVTGIESLQASVTSIFVYPSPANNYLYVSAKNNIEAGACVSLYNMMGQRLLERKVPARVTTLTLSVAGLPSGIYLLTLRNAAGESFTKKVEISHY